MSTLLEYFLPNEIGPWVGALAIYVAASVAVVWLLAVIAARTSLLVEHDSELKAHFGVVIAYLLYGGWTTYFLIRLAMEFKTRDISLWYTAPWGLLDALALLLAVALTGKIGARIAEIRSKGRP